jgi:hypothetical protein
VSRLNDLDRAGTVSATLAAGASGKRATYDRLTGWTTRHGRTSTTSSRQQAEGRK